MASIETLYAEYKKAHPDAQDPLEYLVAFGEDGIMDLLKKSKGRRIVFEEKSGDDNVDYHFE